MKKQVLISLVCGLILVCGPGLAQHNLKLKSKVELNNWKLSSRAYKQEKFLNGATVKLYKADALVSQTTSDQDGHFELDIPASGGYTIEVTYPGCNPKKFVANTRTLHTKTGDVPLVDIAGIIMPKTIKTNDNLGLYQPLVKIEKEHGHGFHMRSNIHDGEYLLIQKFCTANKLGDIALQQKNYQQAKNYYSMAIDMMNGEEYPKEQLKKADEGLKMEMAAKPAKKRNAPQNTSKQAIVAKQNKTTNTSTKRAVETGKATRKTRQVLGK